jgi:hypothetical protein
MDLNVTSVCRFLQLSDFHVADESADSVLATYQTALAAVVQEHRDRDAQMIGMASAIQLADAFAAFLCSLGPFRRQVSRGTAARELANVIGSEIAAILKRSTDDTTADLVATTRFLAVFSG